jgi:hypothetical protein
MSKNKPLLSEGMETLEQITERATMECRNVVSSTKREGFIEGIIAEAARNEQARTKDRELIQTLTNSIGKFLDMANDGDVVVYHLEDDQPPPTEQLESALAIAGEQGYQPTEK